MAGPIARLGPLTLALVAGGCVAPVGELLAPQLALEAPETLDLGWIAGEERVEGRFAVTNIGSVAVVVDGARPMAPVPNLTVRPSGEPVSLRPGEFAEVAIEVTASAAAAGELEVPLVVVVPGLPADDPRLPVVTLIVRISPSGLVAEPNPLTIGPVLYLETQTGTVALRNLRSAPVDVWAHRFEDGRAQYDEAVTRGEFGPLPEVDGAGFLIRLGPGEAREVPIGYTAPNGPGEAKEQAVWRVGTCADRARCELSIVVQGLPDHEAPQARIAPSGVHFGPTPVGLEVTGELRISNEGVRPLTVSDFVFEGSPEMIPALPAEDIELTTGAVVVIGFRYRPDAEGLDNATLRFRTNDPLQRAPEVRVTGSGVVLPPCRVVVRPAVVDFGVVEVFSRRTQGAEIENVGEERCLLVDPRIVVDRGTDEGTFVLEDELPNSITVHPGQAIAVSLTFAPPRPGRHTATLILRTSGDEPVEIPLRGNTPDGVRLSCTPDRGVQVGSELVLSAALNRDAVARSYQWQILSGPRDAGGDFPASFLPNPDSGPTVSFVPRQLGVYVIRVDVETEDGERLTCQTQVSAESGGLKATLTWDGEGDLDLHLHRGARAPWFGDADCHFDNLRPIWVSGDPPAQGANPGLDHDDTSGDGPENIRIAEPEIGVPYTLAVSHFERARGRTARVKLYCGRASTSLDVTSRPFGGNETGACTRNDFWTIATVFFTAPDQCVVQDIDTYRSTREACAAF